MTVVINTCVHVQIDDEPELVSLFRAWMTEYGVWALPNTGEYVSRGSMSLTFAGVERARITTFITEARNIIEENRAHATPTGHQAT